MLDRVDLSLEEKTDLSRTARVVQLETRLTARDGC
jgi:hypothetical protein